ncbi:hypothetical protein ACWGB8_32220 [Kitasatospora sp. NPDC054939]
MTTQGERTPPPADQDTDEPSGAYRTYRRSRLGPRKAVAWMLVVGVVAAGGWIITRPHPGDWIPGLGPSSKEAARTPPVLGTPPPRTVTDTESFDVDSYFPAQRAVEAGGYKGKRSGARQGQDCAETLHEDAKELLKDLRCQGYLSVSFSGVEKPVLSSVTVLRFADEGAAAKAAAALRAKPGALQFILPDAKPAPAPTTGATPKPGTAPRVDAVRHYVTVASSRSAEPAAAPVPAPTTPAGTAGATPGAPAATGQAVPPTASASPFEQLLDEATRVLSYTAGVPFAWT